MDNELFENACWLFCRGTVHRYLMVNAHGCWDGAEKAQRHRELCCFYVAARLGLLDEGSVKLNCPEYVAVHDATRELTGCLDEAIGFPLLGSPDYDTLAPLFFARFHALAMRALSPAGPNMEG